MTIGFKKKLNNLVEQITDFIAWFLGSWWAVIIHTLWFTIWIVFDFNMDTLTLGVSLEAIFIGIFLLMAATKAEVQRGLKETKERQRDRRRIEDDIKLDEKGERRLREVKADLKEIKQEIGEIKTFLHKNK